MYIDNTTVEIVGYYSDAPERAKYRHLLVMNYATGEVFLPREDDMILFIDPTPRSSTFKIDAHVYQQGIVLNVTEDDVKLYRLDNDNDLVVANESFVNPFVIVIRNYTNYPINITFYASPVIESKNYNVQDLPRFEDNRLEELEFDFQTSNKLRSLRHRPRRIFLRTTADPSLISVLSRRGKFEDEIIFEYMNNSLAMNWSRVSIAMWEFVNSNGPSIVVSNFSRFGTGESQKMQSMLQLAAKTRAIQSKLTLTEWTAITCKQLYNMSTLPLEQFQCFGFHSYSEVHHFQNGICPEYNNSDTISFLDVFEEKTSNICRLKNMETTCKSFVMKE